MDETVCIKISYSVYLATSQINKVLCLFCHDLLHIAHTTVTFVF